MYRWRFSLIDSVLDNSWAAPDKLHQETSTKREGELGTNNRTATQDKSSVPAGVNVKRLILNHCD